MSQTVVIVRFNALPAIAALIKQRAEAIVAKAALDIEAQAKDRAPVDTGNLQNSITAEQQKAMAWIVAVGAHYGIYQEFGTVKMSAQPFLLPAFNLVAPQMVEALKRLV